MATFLGSIRAAEIPSSILVKPTRRRRHASSIGETQTDATEIRLQENPYSRSVIVTLRVMLKSGAHRVTGGAMDFFGTKVDPVIADVIRRGVTTFVVDDKIDPSVGETGRVTVGIA